MPDDPWVVRLPSPGDKKFSIVGAKIELEIDYDDVDRVEALSEARRVAKILNDAEEAFLEAQ